MPVFDIATKRFDGVFPETFAEQIGIAGDVRREHHVFERENRVIRGGRLGIQNVEAGGGDPCFGERADERLLVEDLTPSRVDQARPWVSSAAAVASPIKCRVLSRKRHVDRDEIGSREQFIEAHFLDAHARPSLFDRRPGREAMNFMSKPEIFLATRRAIRPKPARPNVWPARCQSGQAR